jgi:hypothetical protein
MFWGCDRRQVDRLRKQIIGREGNGDRVRRDHASGPPLLDDDFVVVSAPTREEETLRSLEYLPQLDSFCAAPHERVNWAVGAGLPMAVITPAIGTYAPENLSHILSAGCGFELPASQSFANLAATLATMREQGQLSEMARRGWGRRPINGVQAIARDLLQKL